MSNLKSILTAEGISKESASARMDVQVLERGTWDSGTEWIKVRVRSGGRSTSGTLYKRGSSYFWEHEDDDDMGYRDEFFSQVVGSAVF